MLQKLKAGVSCKLTYALLLCAVTTSQSFAQSSNDSDTTDFKTERIVITEDDIKKVIPNIENDIVSPAIRIYEVKEEMTSFYSNPKEIIKLENEISNYNKTKLSYENAEKRGLQKYVKKDPVKEYNEKVNYANNLQSAITEILKYIDEYNSSKERYKNKIHLLKEAQRIADNVKLNIVIQKTQKHNYATNIQSSFVDQKLRLYYDEYRVSENEINAYKSELLKIEIPKYEVPKEMLLEKQLEEAKNKTNDKLILKLTNNRIDYKSFIGTFDIIANKYVVENANHEYLQGQLVDDKISGKTSRRKYQMLRNVETNKLYLIYDYDCVIPSNIISDLSRKL